MSRSDAARDFSDLASDLSARCLEAIEQNRLEDIPADALGQAFASVLQVYAAKAQAGENLLPFGRNSGVTATDVAIGCTAMLEAVNLALFELGAWQNMSSVGRIKYDESATERF
ncbi:MAG: hypothetical protein KIT76_01390 [Pseudolabrys sp.]|jgi:hypothetical protein|uniref:hypothetical protein n=1 Tax=Pseudorhodoplanes sp. TaxID=1934341 RepID=UPI002A5C09D8|nr:hypothetical protein [Pseudorhodoplanes sp.]MCW5687176.1 hypothetical protein [Pseudolabrys sp.]HWV43539.1 hypothetical protein [Pseudorhodoplanes sp.]